MLTKEFSKRRHCKTQQIGIEFKQFEVLLKITYRGFPVVLKNPNLNYDELFESVSFPIAGFVNNIELWS